MTKKKKGGKKNRITIDLPVELTDAEHSERAIKLAKMNQKRAKMLQEKSDYLADFRLRMVEHDDKLQELNDIVAKKAELRKVDCRIEMNYKENKVITIREDSNAIVKSRAMKPEERQQELPNTEASKPKAVDAA